MPEPYDDLTIAIRENLSPDAVRLIAARLLGKPDPEPQDSDDDEEQLSQLAWFATFLARMV